MATPKAHVNDANVGVCRKAAAENGDLMRHDITYGNVDSYVASAFRRTSRGCQIESKHSRPGPVREQPTRVLGEMHSSRLTPPRPSGRPFAATRWAFDS